MCVSRTHYDVEIEHYLMKLLDSAGHGRIGSSGTIGVDTSQLTRRTQAQPGQDQAGNAGGRRFSPSLVNMLTEAWTIGSLDYGAGADPHRLHRSWRCCRMKI